MTGAAAAPSSVVLRFPNWIGDAIMALPALDALRGLWPEARLAVQAHARVRPLVEGHPAVDRLLAVPGRGGPGWDRVLPELREGRFPVGILLAPSFSSALLFFLGGVGERIGRRGEARDLLLTRPLPPGNRVTPLSRQLVDLVRAAGYTGGDPPLRLPVPAPAAAAADRWLAARGLGGRPFVTAAPGATYGPAKRWPADRFGALLRRLRDERDLPAVLLGAPDEAELLSGIAREAGEGCRSAAGEDLMTGAALIARSRLLVANDTGLLHVARAVGVPVIGLYGSTSPDWTGPAAGEGEALHAGLACSPCFRRECPLATGRYACLSAITVEQAFESAGRWLAGPAEATR